MTVCIVALYGDGASVVMASDRMVTAHIPIGYEFEYKENTKIVELDGAASVFALIAGDVLRGNEIFDLAMIDQAFFSSDLGVEILIAGSNSPAHTIYTVLNPGTIHDNSSIGHGAIGSGAPHALYSLIEGSYSIFG